MISCACLRAHTHTHTRSHTHAHTHSLTHTHMHTHTHTRALTHTHTHTHGHTHTHTHSLCLSLSLSVSLSLSLSLSLVDVRQFARRDTVFVSHYLSVFTLYAWTEKKNKDLATTTGPVPFRQGPISFQRVKPNLMLAWISFWGVSLADRSRGKCLGR